VGRDVGLVVSGDPGLIGRVALEPVVAFHLEVPEVHLPEPGIHRKGHIPEKSLQSLVRTAHSAGDEPGGVNVIVKGFQLPNARRGQGQVGTAAI